MHTEFVGIERRLERLGSFLRKLEPLRTRPKDELAADTFLRDIVERNLEVAIQACIDIANRIISIEQHERPPDAHGALRALGDLGVLPRVHAERMAPLAGLHNVLALAYLDIDWDEIYRRLQEPSDLVVFIDSIKAWARERADGERRLSAEPLTT